MQFARRIVKIDIKTSELEDALKIEFIKLVRSSYSSF